MIDILIIEDDDPKRDQICEVISSMLNKNIQLHIAKSMNSACRMLDKNTFDTIFLDMSLPNFDGGKTIGASGRQKPLGGRDVLRYLYECEITTPVYIVTGFKDFPDETKKLNLDDLHKELSSDFPEIYKGKVSFSYENDQWKGMIKEIVGRILC